MPFELFKSDNTGKFHFRLKARNGEIILQSEAYSSKAGAENGIESVIKNSQGGDSNFERKASKKDQPYFVLKATNGQVIGKSEMYSSKAAMEKGIQSVIKNAQEAKIKDLTT